MRRLTTLLLLGLLLLLDWSVAAPPEGQDLRPGFLGASAAAAQEHHAPDAGRGGGRDRRGRPTASMVRDRLRTLSGQPRAEELAADALRQARHALRRSAELTRGGRLDAAERARQIAWAALTLASRQIARAGEREALAAARRRLAAAESRATRGREALEHAMRQRADAQRQNEEEESGAASDHEESSE